MMLKNKQTGIFLLLFLLVNGVLAQDHLPFMPGAENESVTHERWLSPAAGYTPSENALRLSAVSGNLLMNRAGGYITIEKGLDSGYFTNIYGITVTVNKYIYLWGGMDLFTRRGLLHSYKGARKEAGLGIVLWNDLIVNTGWSDTVGFSFSLGWKLPVFNNFQ